jgi:hypothetical protein
MIISGWLVYPVTAIDLFSFAWKIPKGTAQYDAHEIAVYGRGYTDAGLYNISIWDWFPGWFKALSAFNKAMLIADAVFLAGLLVFAAIYLVMQIRSGGITFEFPFRKSNGKRSRRKGQKLGNKSGIKPLKKGKKSLFDNAGKVVLMARHRTVSFKDFIFIDTIAYVALAFFILSSPLVRYGALYIWLPAVLMTGKLVTLLFYQRGAEKRLMPVVIAFIAVFIGYKSVRLVMYEIPRFKPYYLLTQQDYMTYELESYEIDGYTFYYPVTGDQTGYAPFPSAPTRADVKLMGDDIKDGFLRNK